MGYHSEAERKFLGFKLKYDPHELFQSDWYRHYRETFGLDRVRRHFTPQPVH